MTLLCDHIVPFTPQGRLDLTGLRALLLWQQASGVEGFVTCAAELLFLDHREKEQVIEVVADTCPGGPVLVCAWDPSPGRALRLGEHAAAHGARALVVPPPLLEPVADDAIVEWYRAFARNQPLPVLAWHSPRFGNDITPAIARRLQDEAGVAGLVDASEDLFRVRRAANARPDAVWAFADDAAGVEGLAGLAGVISRIANCYPQLAARHFKLREPDVADAVPLRARMIQRAGGLPAMKRLLGLHARLPVVGVDEAELSRLPPVAFR